jgi:hypothetical protein
MSEDGVDDHKAERLVWVPCSFQIAQRVVSSSTKPRQRNLARSNTYHRVAAPVKANGLAVLDIRKSDPSREHRDMTVRCRRPTPIRPESRACFS